MRRDDALLVHGNGFYYIPYNDRLALSENKVRREGGGKGSDEHEMVQLFKRNFCGLELCSAWHFDIILITKVVCVCMCVIV